MFLSFSSKTLVGPRHFVGNEIGKVADSLVTRGKKKKDCCALHTSATVLNEGPLKYALLIHTVCHGLSF